MIIWAKIQAWKDPQQILLLADTGVGVGMNNIYIFLRFNIHLRNAYYVLDIIVGVLQILTYLIP